MTFCLIAEKFGKKQAGFSSFWFQGRKHPALPRPVLFLPTVNRHAAMSLRTKFFTLVILSIALAAVPIIWLTYSALQRSSLAFERESFNSILLLVEDNIEASYLDLLTNEVGATLRRKQQLRQMALLARTTWRGSAAQEKAVLKSWLEIVQPFGVHMEVYAGGPRLGDAFFQRITPDMTDLKGQRLALMLEGDGLPEEGAFAVFDPSRRAPGTPRDPALVFFLPVKERDAVIAVGSSLADLTEEARQAERKIARNLQEKFHSLDFHYSGFIALFQSDGTVLAHKGTVDRPLGAIPAALLDTARARRFAELLGAPAGSGPDELYRVAYFKALDWYIVGVVPRSEIEAPAAALVNRLSLVALGSVFLSVLATLLLTMRLTDPLKALTSSARRLAKTDFSQRSSEASADSLAFLADLPTNRRDEVGLLAHAFSQMGKALEENIRRLMEATAAKERMEGELNAARDIQMGILPAPESLAGQPCATASCLLIPAKEVGGDLYDVFPAPDGRQVVVIGDVSGKGVPAALFMSMTVTLIRYVMRDGLSPEEAMSRINAMLGENNPDCMFVTLFIGLFDPATGVFDYANGGHCPPLVIGQGGDVRLLDDISGPSVGVFPGVSYAARRVELRPGDVCLLYTDGVSEALNEANELFGDERVRLVLEAHRTESPAAILAALLAEVRGHQGDASQSDDITMVCFERPASPEGAAERNEAQPSLNRLL